MKSTTRLPITVAERTLGIAHTTASVRKRGRPRKSRETDSGDAAKRRDDWTLEETTPSGAKNRTSSIKQHLSARTNCRELYSDNVFSILSRGRCAVHLAVLEALYIRKLDPEIFVQKENVLWLQVLLLVEVLTMYLNLLTMLLSLLLLLLLLFETRMLSHK